MTHLSSVGKYEVQELVGEGAMGVVYRATDPMLNRSVAVKVMNDALALDESFRTRFLREARAAGSLQHPNVITVYDCGETDGHLYIAMEYVEGTDLEQVIAAKIPLTLSEKLDIVIGVLNGLAFAHKRGIVHRDMKPANIRVNDEGRALIMDFGIAHTTASNVTRTGLVLGTPNYMAPEQVTGGDITPQTDIFSVGVVLYELLTSVKPFEGSTLHSVLFKIVGEEPVSPEKIVTDLRPDLAEVVMKALHKDPAERYASASEMANALTKISTSLSTAPGAHPGSRTLSLRSSIDMALQTQQEEIRRAESQRSWRSGALAAAAVIVLLGGAAFAFSRTGRSAASPPPSVQQQASAPAPASSPVPETPAPSAATVEKPVVKQATPAPTPSRTAEKVATPPARRPAEQAPAPSAQLAAAAALTTKEPVKVAERETTKDVPKAPVVVPPSAPVIQAPAAPAQPASNPSAEIASVVAQYARAIESRDVAELKRVYPGMSSSQSNSFDDFFRSVRSIRAAFSVSSLQVDGASAEAKLSGTYDFVTSSGRNEHQPLTLQAVLRRDGTTWRFVSIR